jgi:hypothetical protein
MGTRVGNARVVPRRELDAQVGDAQEQGPNAVSPLDSERAQRRLRKLEEWLEAERYRQATNRYQMALDEDFYDGLQWADEDAAILQERGQAPLVYNKVAPSVRWVTGTEKRTRIDYRVYPRSKDDRNEAENKTKLLKYIDDVNRSAYARSRAFEDSVKVGIGWLECGIRHDPTSELIFDRYESWRNVLHDSFGFERDCRDWRYVVRQKWLDTDIASAMFPWRRQALKSAAVYSELADLQDYDEWYLGQLLTDRNNQGEYISRRTFTDSADTVLNRRERVKVYEMWYRMPAKVQVMVGGGLHGIRYDPNDDMHNWMVQQQACSVIERVMMVMRCGVFIKGTFLQDVTSPYRHNEFPFTPIWGNRRGRDGQPYGMIRGMRDPQEDFNKRMSKALHALSTRRVVMDKGAVDDVEELREEVARPDSIIEKKHGMEFEIHTDTEIAEEHVKFAEIDSLMLEQAGGVTDELMGRKTNAVSGKAIEARQDQGSTVTTDYFDNLRFGTQLHGQKKLSLAEQFYTMTKTVRVLGERKGYDFITINEPGQDQQGQPTLLNDITKAQADFIVSTQDFRESMRLAAVEQLTDLVTKIAALDIQVALKMLDDVLELSDIPGIEPLIKTLRDITGKRPADEVLTPEEEQAQQQAKREEEAKKQALEQIAIETQMAELHKLQAEAELKLAQAEKARAEAGAGNDSPELQQIRADTAKLVEKLKERVQTAEFKAALAGAGNDAKERMAHLAAATQLRVAEIGANTKLATAQMAGDQQVEQSGYDFEQEAYLQSTLLDHQAQQDELSRRHELERTAMDQRHAAEQGDKERQFKAGEGAANRGLQAQTKAADLAVKVHEGDQQRTHTSTENAASRQHEAKQAGAERKLKVDEGTAQREHASQENRAERKLKQTSEEAGRQHDSAENRANRRLTAQQGEAERETKKKLAKKPPQKLNIKKTGKGLEVSNGKKTVRVKRAKDGSLDAEVVDGKGD